jgi:nitric oxide reductase subunit B
MSEDVRRPLLVSKTWVQSSLLVFLLGFAVLGFLAYRTYLAGPPTPQRVVDPNQRVLMTGEDIQPGQRVSLRRGLMEYGSVFGHGGYLGPDYTADYLRRAAISVSRSNGDEEGVPSARTLREFKENRFDAETATLHSTAAQADGHRVRAGGARRHLSRHRPLLGGRSHGAMHHLFFPASRWSTWLWELSSLRWKSSP